MVMFSLSQWVKPLKPGFNKMGISEINWSTEVLSFPYVSAFKVQWLLYFSVLLKRYKHCLKTTFTTHCVMSSLSQGIICTINYTIWNMVNCCSVTKLCLTLCDLMNWSTPGFPVLWYLLEFAQTRVRWVGDAIQSSYLLSSLSPPAFNLSQHHGLFQCVGCLH